MAAVPWALLRKAASQAKANGTQIMEKVKEAVRVVATKGSTALQAGTTYICNTMCTVFRFSKSRNEMVVRAAEDSSAMLTCCFGPSSSISSRFTRRFSWLSREEGRVTLHHIP